MSIVILTVHCSKLDSWILFTNANPSKLGSTAPTLDIPTVNIAFCSINNISMIISINISIRVYLKYYLQQKG